MDRRSERRKPAGPDRAKVAAVAARCGACERIACQYGAAATESFKSATPTTFFEHEHEHEHERRTPNAEREAHASAITSELPQNQVDDEGEHKPDEPGVVVQVDQVAWNRSGRNHFYRDKKAGQVW